MFCINKLYFHSSQLANDAIERMVKNEADIEYGNKQVNIDIVKITYEEATEDQSKEDIYKVHFGNFTKTLDSFGTFGKIATT